MAEGPCLSWVTGAEVADCCAAAEDEIGTFTTLLDDAAYVASELLYELSGRRWAGTCERTVRPCHSGCGCANFQVLSRGHIVYPDYHWLGSDCEGRACGCRDLSRVRLSGYVTEITEVKIDGLVIDESAYRVDEHLWLTRRDGGRWPGCARLDLDDTEEGTFSVTYEYGKEPPESGIEAAKQLACQIFLRCSGSSADCAIPEGAVRVVRQGITIERAVFAFDKTAKVWRTGMSSVDWFLNAYNPNGIRRRALFISPGSRGRHARPVG